MRRPHYLLFALAIITLLSSLLTACSSSSSVKHNSSMQMAALSEMPPEVQSAPVVVQEAYQFAAANPEVLEAIPCYCGCGAMGHTSNYSCYFTGESAGDGLAFDPHALGCSICVDITQDSMRLLQQGKSMSEIRAYIDGTYASFGPSNMP
ncbi:MAG TPA: PCYCGC motif-containing (lipo)protein [Anaerolineales bacterium]